MLYQLLMSKSYKVNIFAAKIVIIYFCLASLPLWANELVNLPLHDETYQFIKRLAAKKVIKNGLLTTLPLTRKEVAQHLVTAKEQLDAGQIQLTVVEQKQLEKYLWLFGNEIRSINPNFPIEKSKKYLLTYKNDTYRIDFDPNVQQEFVAKKQRMDSPQKDMQKTYIFTANLIGRAKLGEHFGIADYLHDRILLGDTEYNPYANEIIQPLEEVRGIRSMEAYAVLSFPWVTFEMGKDDLWWGPGWHGTLLMSDNSVSKDLIKLVFPLGKLKFTHVNAILRTTELEETHSKYLAAHRLEIAPFSFINLGISEGIILGDKFDLRFLNPFLVYMIEGPDERKGNNQIGLDMSLTLIPNIELYGELLIDDLQVHKGLDFLRAWNSKYGTLLGGYWVDPFKIKDTDLRVEYAFLNQYAYTHRFPFTRYTHQGFVIGHWLGSDSDDIFASLKHWFTDKIKASLVYELERHGEGDVTKKHPLDGEPEPTGTPIKQNWEFLSGVTESTHSLSIGFSYHSIGRYSFNLEFTNFWTKNAKNQQDVDETGQLLTVSGSYLF